VTSSWFIIPQLCKI